VVSTWVVGTGGAGATGGGATWAALANDDSPICQAAAVCLGAVSFGQILALRRNFAKRLIGLLQRAFWLIATRLVINVKLGSLVFEQEIGKNVRAFLEVPHGAGLLGRLLLGRLGTEAGPRKARASRDDHEKAKEQNRYYALMLGAASYIRAMSQIVRKDQLRRAHRTRRTSAAR